MHDAAVVAEVIRLKREGRNNCEIARATGVPRRTVSDWVSGRSPRATTGHASVHPLGAICPSCGGSAHGLDGLPPAYVYLLGVYLGDGCLSEHRRGVWRLRISLDARYPGIIEECRRSIETVMPANRVHILRRHGNYVRRPEHSHVEVSAYSKRWICLFPQHGPGRKHTRPIRLAPWQQDLVAQDPDRLIRGLLHSDGCRFVNTGRGWRHPRYAFSNHSDDIRQIFRAACDMLELHWTNANKTCTSRARPMSLASTSSSARRNDSAGQRRRH